MMNWRQKTNNRDERASVVKDAKVLSRPWNPGARNKRRQQKVNVTYSILITWR
jgi:hypothetical protein